ncbi:MAG: hypothetical protein ABIQ99_02435 [Thermoflexales bacterium]
MKVIDRSLRPAFIFVAVGFAAIMACMIGFFLVSLVSGPEEVYQPLADLRNADEVVDQFLVALVRNDFDAAKSVVAADQLPGLQAWMSTRTGFRYCEQSWKFPPGQGVSEPENTGSTGIKKSYRCSPYLLTVDNIQLRLVGDRYRVESWATPIETQR